MATKPQQEIEIPPHLQEWWKEMKRKEKFYGEKINKALEGLRKLGHDV